MESKEAVIHLSPPVGTQPLVKVILSGRKKGCLKHRYSHVVLLFCLLCCVFCGCVGVVFGLADPQSYFLKSSGVGSTSDRKDAKFVSGTGKNVNTRTDNERASTEGKSTYAAVAASGSTATTSSNDSSGGSENSGSSESSGSSDSSGGSSSSGDSDAGEDGGSHEEKGMRGSGSFAGTLEGFFDQATSLKSEPQEPVSVFLFFAPFVVARYGPLLERTGSNGPGAKEFVRW